MSGRRLELLVTDLRKSLEDGNEALYPGPSTDKVPLPQAHQVLYVDPLPNRARKQCKNCCLFVVDQTCMIHSPNIVVTPDMVCGYWVGGVPSAERLGNRVEYVDPNYSGLAVVKNGSSCDNCKWFKPVRPEGGTCMAVRNEEGNDLATVHPKGCCARWEQ